MLLETVVYQMSGSESWPRKVELTRTHSIKKCNYHESLHITIKPVITPNGNQPYHIDIH